MMWNCGWENGKLFLGYFVTYKQPNRGDRRKEWKQGRQFRREERENTQGGLKEGGGNQAREM